MACRLDGAPGTAPSHYLKQCWIIVNWTLRNKLQWNFNRNSNILIQGNALEHVVCEMAYILSRPQCVNSTKAGKCVHVMTSSSPRSLTVFTWFHFSINHVIGQVEHFPQSFAISHGISWTLGASCRRYGFLWHGQLFLNDWILCNRNTMKFLIWKTCRPKMLITQTQTWFAHRCAPNRNKIGNIQLIQVRTKMLGMATDSCFLYM